MDKRETLDLVRRFSAALQTVFNPARLVLYGSYATGSQTAASDIDVAVIVDHVNGDFLDQEIQLYRLRREIDDRIEPVLIEAGDDKSGRGVWWILMRRFLTSASA